MIRSHKIWFIYCDNCLKEYGQFDTKAAAERREQVGPLCPDCDGEHY